MKNTHKLHKQVNMNVLKTIRRKYNSLGLRIANKFKFITIPFLPINLDIEPINICNFKCKHCKVSYWKKNTTKLTVEEFVQIISQFPNLKNIKLQGLGEPLLNKELPFMMKIGNEREIRMEFFSNESIYNEESWDSINKLKNIHITFSMDAASKDIFEGIRNGSDFDVVKDNIKRIVKGNESKYSFWTVLNKENIEELGGIVDLAVELGIVSIELQTFLSDWNSPDVKVRIDTLLFDISEEKFQNNFSMAKKNAEKSSVTLKTYDGNYFSKKQKCSWPFTSAFIASNGDVVPCCVIADSDVIKMGNLFETPFKEIWNSEKYKEFRKSISKHELNDVCKKCYGEKI